MAVSFDWKENWYVTRVSMLWRPDGIYGDLFCVTANVMLVPSDMLYFVTEGLLRMEMASWIETGQTIAAL